MTPEIICYINGIPIAKRHINRLPYNPYLRQRAKLFRKRRILTEVIFWMHVRSRSFHAIDFDRQRVIGNYIVDFYCRGLGLVVEIDGSSHNDREEYDRVREEYLVSLGLVVYRISALRVTIDLENVLRELGEFIVVSFTTTGICDLGEQSHPGVPPPL